MIIFRKYLSFKNILFTGVILSATIILVALHIQHLSVYLDFLIVNHSKELEQVPIIPSNSLVEEQPNS